MPTTSPHATARYIANLPTDQQRRYAEAQRDWYRELRYARPWSGDYGLDPRTADTIMRRVNTLEIDAGR